MIEPTKYMDLEISVLNLSYFLLIKLKKDKVLNYDLALDYLVKLFGSDVNEVFISTLSFLFLLDKVEYNSKKDLIIYKNEN